MPDAGENEADDGKRFPSDVSKSAAIKKTADGFTYIDPSQFHEYFAIESRLFGVDSVKLTGPQIAEIMNGLREGFENGHYLEALPVATWPLERAVEAYEVVAKGGARTKQILVPG
jgi:hypothetical protein